MKGLTSRQIAIYCKCRRKFVYFYSSLTSPSVSYFPCGFIVCLFDGMIVSCNLHSIPLEGQMDDCMPYIKWYREMDVRERGRIFWMDRYTLTTHARLIHLNVIHTKLKVSYQPHSGSCEI